MAEKPVKVKQPEKVKANGRAQEAARPEKSKSLLAKAPEKEKSQPKQPNRMVRWWRETLGEMRKVSWPTPKDAWRLTVIVIVVMFATSVFLGALDYVFSRLVVLLVA